MKRTELRRSTPMKRDLPISSASRGRAKGERLAGAKPAGNPIPPAVRAQVRQRSNGQCELLAADDCTFQATEQHHRKRRRDGGHALSNVVDACSPCHAHAHAHPQLAREMGWIVSAFAVDPALEPVRYGDPVERLTWFDDTGMKHTAYTGQEARRGH